MTLRIMSRHATVHDDTVHDDTEHSDTLHNDTRQNIFILPSVAFFLGMLSAMMVDAGNTKVGKYHCTVDLLFDWFRLVCFAN